MKAEEAQSEKDLPAQMLFIMYIKRLTQKIKQGKKILFSGKLMKKGEKALRKVDMRYI